MALIFLAAAVAARPGVAAEFRESDRAHAITMLRGVRREIEQSYFDTAFKGIDLNANADVAGARIAKANSIGEAFGAIAQFVLELDDSHTFFIPPEQTVRVDYGWDMGIVGNTCFVLRVRAGSDAARQGVARGDVVTAVNGFRPKRENLWRLEYLFKVLRPQPGLHVELIPSSGAARELDIAAEVHTQKRVMDLTVGNGKWDRATIIEQRENQQREMRPSTVAVGSQVLILRMPSFSIEEGLIRRALHAARNREVLIIDLRGNQGGSIAVLEELIGSLAADDIPIGTKAARGHSDPQIAKGTGNEAFKGRVFVLVDAESASASEVMARVLQLANRGTVIGDRTAGEVMESRYRPLGVLAGDKAIVFGVNMTVADLIMSDGGRLEKTGVRPDFEVLPSGADMAANRDPALAQALTFAGQPMDSAAAGALLSTR